MTHYTPETDPTPRKPKSKRKWLWIGLAVLAVIIIASVSAQSSEDTSTPMAETAAPTAPAAPAGTDEEAPQPAPTTEDHSDLPSNGKLKVGTDIEPGNYKATPTRGGMGYAARCADRNCQIGAGLIDNYMITGPDYLEVLPTDAFVEVQGVQLTPEG